MFFTLEGKAMSPFAFKQMITGRLFLGIVSLQNMDAKVHCKDMNWDIACCPHLFATSLFLVFSHSFRVYS
jgi:hypothetical protein